MPNQDPLTPALIDRGHVSAMATPPFPAPMPREPQPLDEEEMGDESSIMVRRSLAALYRYKWLVLAIVVLSAAAGFVVKDRYAPEYEVEGKVWIAPTGQEGGARDGPVRGAALLPSTSWSDLMVSYAIVGKAVRELHLYLHAANQRDEALFKAVDVAESVRPGSYVVRMDTTGTHYQLLAVTAHGDTAVERGTVGDSVGRTIGLRWLPDPAVLATEHSIAFSLTTPRVAAQQVQSSVRAVLPWQGNIMRVYVTGSSPWRVSLIANSLLRHFVETAAEFKRRNLTEVRKTLDVQLSFASTALQEADSALEKFRRETITLPPTQAGPEGSVDANDYFRLKLAEETVAHQRTALEQTLSDIRGGRLDVQALWQVLPADGGTQDIGALLQEYARKQSQLRNDLLAFTEDYQGIKDSRAALSELRDKTIPAMVGTMIEQLKRREQGLHEQIAGRAASLQSIPPRMIEEVRLTRDVDARRQLFDMLQRRAEEARLAELSVEPDLSILDVPNVPEWPISNRGRQVFMITVAAGFGFAVLLALMLDRLDKRIRYLQQVPNRLKLRVLGAVPHARRHRKPDALNVAQLVEAFRSIRLAATYAATPGQRLLLAVTSAGASEGKSFVSANLALAFAEAGCRTLLIDADVRRGRLHTVFDVPRRPGLVDALRDAATLSQSIVPTSHARLSLVPSGSRVKSAPELLTSDYFRDFVDGLQATFDVIIIDTPPLGAGMDPHALCVAATNVLFVARLAHTDGAVARQKLEILERFPVRILGAVVNDVSASLGLNNDYSYLPAYIIGEEEIETVGSTGPLVHALQ